MFKDYATPKKGEHFSISSKIKSYLFVCVLLHFKENIFYAPYEIFQTCFSLLKTFGDRAPLSTGNQAAAAGILGPNKCVPR